MSYDKLKVGFWINLGDFKTKLSSNVNPNWSKWKSIATKVANPSKNNQRVNQKTNKIDTWITADQAETLNSVGQEWVALKSIENLKLIERNKGLFNNRTTMSDPNKKHIFIGYEAIDNTAIQKAALTLRMAPNQVILVEKDWLDDQVGKDLATTALTNTINITQTDSYLNPIKLALGVNYVLVPSTGSSKGYYAFRNRDDLDLLLSTKDSSPETDNLSSSELSDPMRTLKVILFPNLNRISILVLDNKNKEYDVTKSSIGLDIARIVSNITLKARNGGLVRTQSSIEVGGVIHIDLAGFTNGGHIETLKDMLSENWKFRSEDGTFIFEDNIVEHEIDDVLIKMFYTIKYNWL